MDLIISYDILISFTENFRAIKIERRHTKKKKKSRQSVAFNVTVDKKTPQKVQVNEQINYRHLPSELNAVTAK